MLLRFFAQNSYKRQYFVCWVCIFFLSFLCCQAVNKYSKEANQPDAAPVGDKDSWKSIDKPFRLAKINLIWAKAQKVTRLAFLNLNIFLNNTMIYTEVDRV